MTTAEAEELVLLSQHDYFDELSRDLLSGLDRSPRRIPSKYFYDARGGELFERITELPEYYLTRCELQLLAAEGPSVLSIANPVEILELGSGSAEKAKLLLGAEPTSVARYLGLDVNADALIPARKALQDAYPNLEVGGLIGDFITDLEKVPETPDPRLIAFFGSTIGNLDPADRPAFLAGVAGTMKQGDAFLLGVDLLKDLDVIHAAYDDTAGLTAAFTRNVLGVINRELGANFAVDEFEHVPRWNDEKQAMEAWLRAPYDMDVYIKDLEMSVFLAAGEEVHTEISCKFTREEMEAELAAAGLRVSRWYTDSQSYFAHVLAHLT